VGRGGKVGGGSHRSRGWRATWGEGCAAGDFGDGGGDMSPW
jgi:hypothetical protein